MSYDSLVDPENAPGDLDGLTKSLSDAVTSSVADPTDPNNKAPDNNTTQEKPEYIEQKFWTGDLEESLRKQHKGLKNLESAYGRQSNDLGLQRQMIDRFLDLKRTDDLSQNTPEPVNIEGADLLDKPNEALDSFLKPRLEKSNEPIQQRLNQLENLIAQTQFANRHPDYETVGNDPKFVAWVNQSAYRSRVAQQALNGDFLAADELMSEWKRISSNDNTTDDGMNNAQNLEEARKVGLETSANSAGASGSGKVWRRADLIRLKMERPEVYEDPKFQEEILKAYSEGRVK
jgi:hypothetical protein